MVGAWEWGWDMTRGRQETVGHVGGMTSFCLGYDVYFFLLFQLLMLIIGTFAASLLASI